MREREKGTWMQAHIMLKVHGVILEFLPIMHGAKLLEGNVQRRQHILPVDDAHRVLVEDHTFEHFDLIETPKLGGP